MFIFSWSDELIFVMVMVTRTAAALPPCQSCGFGASCNVPRAGLQRAAGLGGWAGLAERAEPQGAAPAGEDAGAGGVLQLGHGKVTVVGLGQVSIRPQKL